MAFQFVNYLIVEDMEREEERNRMRLFRRTIRDAQNPFSISEQEFVKNFRLNKEASLDIINILAPHMEQGTQRNRLPVMLRVSKIFLQQYWNNYQIHFIGVNSIPFFGCWKLPEKRWYQHIVVLEPNNG